MNSHSSEVSHRLIGGLEHEFYFSILGFSSPQLTFIFFRGVETTNQQLDVLLLFDHAHIRLQWHRLERTRQSGPRLLEEGLQAPWILMGMSENDA
jgi:hypothetical protein